MEEEVVKIFLLERDVALLLFSWPTVYPVLPDSSPSLERHPWERRPLDLCWWGGADHHTCREENGRGHCLLLLS